MFIKKNIPPKSSKQPERHSCSAALGCFPDYYGIFPNLAACQNSGCITTVPCFEVGDIGPGGGIICAVPYMNINDPPNGIVGPVVNPLQGSFIIENPTEYYYELSSENLNLTVAECPVVPWTEDDDFQWGSASSYAALFWYPGQTYSGPFGIDVASDFLYSNYWIPDNVVYPGYTNSPNNEMIGEGKKATQEMLAVNNALPLNLLAGYSCSGTPPYTFNIKSAFEVCDNYNGGKQEDWFLPTVSEMSFARNYTPPGTLYVSTQSIGGVPASDRYWTCNTAPGLGPGGGWTSAWENGPIEPFITDTLYSGLGYPGTAGVPDTEIGFTVSPDPINSTAGSTGHGWRYREFRGRGHNIRAMRRFLCADLPNPIDDCTFYAGATYMGAELVSNPITYPVQPTAIQIATPADMMAIEQNNLPTGSTIIGTCAKYGNYVYNLFSYYIGGHGFSETGVVKMFITGNSLSYVQHYLPSSPYNLYGVGLCSKDEDTLIFAQHDIAELQLQANGTIIVNVLFSLPSGVNCQGDIIWRPSDNTFVILTTEGFGVNTISHYTYNGTLIDLVPIPYPVGAVTLFCYDGNIYFPTEFSFNSPQKLFRVDTYSLSVTNLGQIDLVPAFPPGNWYGDGATNPDCCGLATPPDPVYTCGIIGQVIGGIGSVYNPVYYPDLISTGAAAITIFDSLAWATSAGIVLGRIKEVARYDDKIWMYINHVVGGVTSVAGILELDFFSSIPSASFNRLIPLQNQALVGQGLAGGWLAAGVGIDSTTVVFSRYCPSCPGSPNDIIKFDISGITAVETILFPTIDTVVDILYLQSSDTYVTVEHPGALPYVVNHYTATGTLLGTANLAGPAEGIFCYDGNIYIPMNVTGNFDLWVLDLASMTITISSQTNVDYYLFSDSATSPECCPVVEPPQHDPCQYFVGDIGPGGGVIVFEPNTGVNTSNYYYEIGPVDLAVGTTTDLQFQGVPQNIVGGSPNPTPGAEWGAYKTSVYLSANNTSTLFGEGANNTSVLVFNTAFFSNDSVAAQLCATYNGGGQTDWFLPSLDEFDSSITTGVFNDSLYPGNGQYKPIGLYWTSSAHYHLADPHLDGKAYGLDTTTGSTYIGYRPYTLSVRPMRRFICYDLTPCDINPVCSCVEYNYRDGFWNFSVPGQVGMPVGGMMIAGTPNSNDWDWCSLQSQYIGACWYGGGLEDNVIGGGLLYIWISHRDVMGNDYNVSMQTSMATGYTITIWSRDYVFLGKWSYDVLEYNYGAFPWGYPGGPGLGVTVGQNSWNNHSAFYLGNPVHLDGPNPIVDFTDPNGTSLTHSYIKVEADFNSAVPASQKFESACNAHIWGNIQFPTYGSWNEIPSVCDPANVNAPGGWNDCVLTWGTQPHYSFSGSSLWVAADGLICDAGCGVSIVNPGTAKLENNPKKIFTSIPKENPLINETKGNETEGKELKQSEVIIKPTKKRGPYIKRVSPSIKKCCGKK